MNPASSISEGISAFRRSARHLAPHPYLSRSPGCVVSVYRKSQKVGNCRGSGTEHRRNDVSSALRAEKEFPARDTSRHFDALPVLMRHSLFFFIQEDRSLCGRLESFHRRYDFFLSIYYRWVCRRGARIQANDAMNILTSKESIDLQIFRPPRESRPTEPPLNELIAAFPSIFVHLQHILW